MKDSSEANSKIATTALKPSVSVSDLFLLKTASRNFWRKNFFLYNDLGTTLLILWSFLGRTCFAPRSFQAELFSRPTYYGGGKPSVSRPHSHVQREPEDVTHWYVRCLLSNASISRLSPLVLEKKNFKSRGHGLLCVNILHNWEHQYFFSCSLFAEHLFRILISFCWTFVRRHLAPVKRSRYTVSKN